MIIIGHEEKKKKRKSASTSTSLQFGPKRIRWPAPGARIIRIIFITIPKKSLSLLFIRRYENADSAIGDVETRMSKQKLRAVLLIIRKRTRPQLECLVRAANPDSPGIFQNWGRRGETTAKEKKKI